MKCIQRRVMDVLLLRVLNCLQLLQKQKDHRLGARNDFLDIRNHSFFASIDWAALDRKDISPPYNPNTVCHFLSRASRVSCCFILIVYDKGFGTLLIYIITALAILLFVTLAPAPGATMCT